MHNFDFIGTHAPQNRTASNVVSSGIHYECEIKSRYHWSVQKKTIEPDKIDGDLRGERFGRLLVIGKLSKKYSRKIGGLGISTYWQVKCVCGQYERRTKEELVNGIKPKCLCCRDLDNIKKKDKIQSYGVEHLLPKDWLEFIGFQAECFKVIGATEETLRMSHDGIHCTQWKCKCICGNNFVLSYKKILKCKDKKDRACIKCEEVRNKLHKDYYEKNQTWPDDKNLLLEHFNKIKNPIHS